MVASKGYHPWNNYFQGLFFPSFNLAGEKPAEFQSNTTLQHGTHNYLKKLLKIRYSGAICEKNKHSYKLRKTELICTTGPSRFESVLYTMHASSTPKKITQPQSFSNTKNQFPND